VRFTFIALCVVAHIASPAAWAQADANATKAAGDAFGFRSGDDSVGIYDETSVRGFNLEARATIGSTTATSSGIPA
jgi:hypothetical protein